MAYSWNLFFFPWIKRFKVFMSIRPLMAHSCVDLTGSRWQTSPLNTVAFLPILRPVPLVLPRSHVELQGDMCWVFVHRKATSLCPLSQWTQISVGCVENRGAISSGPLLWAHPMGVFSKAGGQGLMMRLCLMPVKIWHCLFQPWTIQVLISALFNAKGKSICQGENHLEITT